MVAKEPDHESGKLISIFMCIIHILELIIQSSRNINHVHQNIKNYRDDAEIYIVFIFKTV